MNNATHLMNTTPTKTLRLAAGPGHLFPANLPRCLAVPLFLLCAVLLARPCVATPGEWENTGSLNIGRRYQSGIATQLLNGKVLVEAGAVGGETSPTAELYDPSAGTWTLTGSLNNARFLHTATQLPDGRVLVAAGADIAGGIYFPIASAELYDPATGTWAVTGSLNTARLSHSSTLLLNGKVLVVGGQNPGGLASAELYDSASGAWSNTGSLSNGHSNHTATLLANGMVLVAGGFDSNNLVSTRADVYNPATGTWTVTGNLNTPRFSHTATLLPNGMVLVAGGANGTGFPVASAELYDPATGTWTVTGTLNTARELHTATLLPNGLVLVAAGFSPTGPVNSAEIYDSATGSWAATGSLNTARQEHAATLLANGMVLVAGGADGGGSPLASAELYDPGIGITKRVEGRGAIDNQGNEVTFRFRASQSDENSNLGQFSFCDPAAGVCLTNGRIQSLSITGNSAEFSGLGRVQDVGRVTFNVSVTDNGSGGTSDTISVSLSNGYSAGGTLTSGDIQVQ